MVLSDTESIVVGEGYDLVFGEGRECMMAWRGLRSSPDNSSGGGVHRTGNLTSLWKFCSGVEGQIGDDWRHHGESISHQNHQRKGKT